MKTIKEDDSGKITKVDFVDALEGLASLVDYNITSSELAKVGYLWSIVDVDQTDELKYDDV